MEPRYLKKEMYHKKVWMASNKKWQCKMAWTNNKTWTDNNK